METLIAKLRYIELMILRPTSLRARWFVLTASAVVVVLLLAAAILRLMPPHYLRGFAYLLIAAYTRVVVANLKPGVDYHPGHLRKEALVGWAITILAALTFSLDWLRATEVRYGISILVWTPWIWITILLVGQISLMDFVIRRNNDPDRIVVKTEEGLAQVPDQRTRERLGQLMAACLRHGLVSKETREQIAEGLGIPPNSIWAEEVRLAALRRREEMARRDVIAAEVEMRALEDGE